MLPLLYHGDGTGTFKTTKDGIGNHNFQLLTLPHQLQQKSIHIHLLASFSSNLPGIDIYSQK